MNKRYRLRKNKDFQFAYKKGRSLGHPLLVLIFRRSNQSNKRIGFSINKKFGKAVKRNRIKRQLREILNSKMDTIKGGYDIIFIVRKDAKEAVYMQLDRAVHNLLKRAGLYKKGEKSS